MKKHSYQSPVCDMSATEFGDTILATSLDGVSNEPISGSENDFTSDWSNI